MIAKNLLILGVGVGIGYYVYDYRQKKLVPNPEDMAEREIEERLMALDNERYSLDRGGLDKDYLSELPTRYRI